ncbi:hypothetical protein COLO4_10336 [Corchorus olitorius]|uniref:Uncharacterized protein n=1 Tax=Corchorus olitorius TaxID=93759 RepID=A0A1R3K904_9ROSI|nr:hypothetical protein COLO4_10336 [Corchorus olitorius]
MLVEYVALIYKTGSDFAATSIGNSRGSNPIALSSTWSSR